MSDEQKPANEIKPAPGLVVNNGPTLLTLVVAFSVSSIVTAGLVVGGFVWIRSSVDPTPGPSPAPVVETVKPTLIDSTARRNGIRDDSIKAPLVELSKIGSGTYTLTFEPDGKSAVVWTVVVTGGDKPAPVKPPIPDEPLPQPPPVDPNTKVTAATYVYEKDQGGVPSAVMSGLNRLNREKKILATVFERDSTDGSETPEQYKVPLAEANKAGLPALVLTNGATVLKVIKAPKTEAEIMDAVN